MSSNDEVKVNKEAKRATALSSSSEASVVTGWLEHSVSSLMMHEFSFFRQKSLITPLTLVY
jgi:hypothetical protein